MAESRLIVEEMLALCLQRIALEENALSTELDFMEVAKNFEVVRKQWLHAELELKKYKELLVKSDVAKAALEVKLKHTRNQLDVEMKKRYRLERDFQYLQRQMQLMCDILVHDNRSSACLNDEQKSLLATFDHKGPNVTLHRSSKRLTAIDESSFLSHSDISYDRTDDDVDLDTTVIKPLRSRARERRRSSMGVVLGAAVGKRGRGGNVSAELLERRAVEKEVETIVKASVMTPDRGQIHMVVDITQEAEKMPCSVSGGASSSTTGGGEREGGGEEGEGGGDQTSVWFPAEEGGPGVTVEPSRAQRPQRHLFLSKTVIRPETCSPCGKRIRFGKLAAKCRICHLVLHPECKPRCSDSCSPSAAGGPAQEELLEAFAPRTHPRVPPLLVECVKEIERRGLAERGLYRVPGGERQVRELRQRFLGGKNQLQLGKVSDVHVICGLLKDFLRRLREPLVTFRLHRAFMEASEKNDDENGAALMFRAVAELPKVNGDTLAFLMLHLHRVMRSPACQMDRNNLSRVFGPTLVGHGMPKPSPSTIVRDTAMQPKVVSLLLSLPEDHWRRVLAVQTSSGSQDGHGPVRLFRPLTSPELRGYHGAPAGAPPRGSLRNSGFAEPGRKFFTSPS